MLKLTYPIPKPKHALPQSRLIHLTDRREEQKHEDKNERFMEDSKNIFKIYSHLILDNSITFLNDQ